MKTIGIAAVLLSLAACSGGIPGAGGGLPEVRMVNRSGDVAPPARDYIGLPVRSFQAGADGEWEEFAGAQCTVTSGLYRANLTTPARVILPDLGPDAEPVRAVCGAGALNGSDEAAPEYGWEDTEERQQPGRITFGGGWWRGYQKSGPLSYRDIAVGMR